MSVKTERVLRERVLFSGKVFSVSDLEIQLPGGEVVHWEIVDKRGDSVAMVPIDEQGCVQSY